MEELHHRGLSQQDPHLHPWPVALLAQLLSWLILPIYKETKRNEENNKLVLVLQIEMKHKSLSIF